MGIFLLVADGQALLMLPFQYHDAHEGNRYATVLKPAHFFSKKYRCKYDSGCRPYGTQ